MYYVYVLQIKKSGRFYIGQTQNLTKRLQKHSRGETKSLKNRGELDVVYVEGCSSRAEAMKREKQIKSYKGGKAFKRLLAIGHKRKTMSALLAEVPPEAGYSGFPSTRPKDPLPSVCPEAHTGPSGGKRLLELRVEDRTQPRIPASPT